MCEIKNSILSPTREINEKQIIQLKFKKIYYTQYVAD
jgi:hypothetical protein